MSSDDISVYRKTYVEHGDGWRIAIVDNDGAVDLIYEEFDKNTNQFVVTKSLCLGPAEYAKRIGEEIVKFVNHMQENA